VDEVEGLMLMFERSRSKRAEVVRQMNVDGDETTSLEV